MLEADKPIVALPYSFKGMNWNSVADAVRKGVPAEYLPEFCGYPVWKCSWANPIHEVVRVESVGTGMMLIKREVFQALADAHPEWKFRFKPMPGFDNPKREFSFDFFQMRVDPKLFFCGAASELGFGTWVFPMARTVHIPAASTTFLTSQSDSSWRVLTPRQ